jgi:hypothetical protein
VSRAFELWQHAKIRRVNRKDATSAAAATIIDDSVQREPVDSITVERSFDFALKRVRDEAPFCLYRVGPFRVGLARNGLDGERNIADAIEKAGRQLGFQLRPKQQEA